MNDITLTRNDRFKRVQVSLSFILPFKKEYICYSNLLSPMLLNTSKKYKTLKEINEECNLLYGVRLRNKNNVIGNLFINQFIISFISPKYTENDMYKKPMNLFKELIFNPNVINNTFDKEIFENEKKNIIQTIENSKSINSLNALSNYNKIMYKGTPYEHTNLSLLSKYNKITNEDVYNFYKQLINESNFKITVSGDFDEKMLSDEIDKIKSNLSKDLKKLPKPMLKPIEVAVVQNKKDRRESNQSNLLVGYIFKDLTERERKYVLTIYNIILGKMNNSVLFVNVREKKSLCYHVNSFIHSLVPSLTIECEINESNYYDALMAIKESINIMNNKKEVEKLIVNAINTINIGLNDYYDDLYKISNYPLNKELFNDVDIEEQREIYKGITVDEIVELNNKMILSTTYFQEGKVEED